MCGRGLRPASPVVVEDRDAEFLPCWRGCRRCRSREHDGADRHGLEQPVVALERGGISVPGEVGLEGDLRHFPRVGRPWASRRAAAPCRGAWRAPGRAQPGRSPAEVRRVMPFSINTGSQRPPSGIGCAPLTSGTISNGDPATAFGCDLNTTMAEPKGARRNARSGDGSEFGDGEFRWQPGLASLTRRMIASSFPHGS